jgi:hypothetical protein
MLDWRGPTWAAADESKVTITVAITGGLVDLSLIRGRRIGSPAAGLGLVLSASATTSPAGRRMSLRRRRTRM